MKVLFPIGFFYPSQRGGPCNSIYWMAKALRREKVDVNVVAMNLDVKKKVHSNRWLHTSYGKVIYLSTLHYRIGLLFVLVSIMKGIKADIVHLTGLFAPTSLNIAIPLFFLKKKIIWSIRGELDPEALIYNNKKKKWIIWILKKINLSEKVVFHATCKAEVNYIKAVFGEEVKIINIPNLLEIPIRIEPEHQENFLLYLGRIHPKKGIDQLLKALGQCSKFRKSDFVLKIAGTGETKYVNSLKNIIRAQNLQDRVLFLGQVTGIAKQKLLANAYFLIMPSHTENFGNVVVEALAQSTPVIASKNSPWKILEDKHCGFWVKNSITQLSLTIKIILEMEKERYINYRKQALQLATNKFDVEKNIHLWITKYQLLIEKK